MYRSMVYSFPEAVLDPGEEQAIKVDLHDAFKARRLIFTGTMHEIRGWFQIRHTRRPPLNRDDTYGYSTLRRWSNGRVTKLLPGKTVIQYQGQHGMFEREYRPENVRYIEQDPLSYIRLMQVQCGKENGMPSNGGVSTLFFSSTSFGNGMMLPTATVSMTLQLKNDGDVQVSVRASALGYEYGRQVQRISK